MAFRRMTRVASFVVLLAALIVLCLQVEVEGAGRAAGCGSPLDVVVDRVDWRDWWAQDLNDPETAVSSTLLRTVECPGAVNARIVVIGGLLFGGLILASIEWLRAGGSGRDDGVDDGTGLDDTAPDGSANRIRTLGRMTTGAGAVLTVGGVVAIVFLVADSESTLFLYVPRLVVALIGLIVLIPAIALFVGGRAMDLTGRLLADLRRDDDTT